MLGDKKKNGECFFVELLLGWWKRTLYLRNYPWREEKDPYKVLIAEILLQRTRRDKVVEVYSRFIKRFPTPESLAKASIKDVESIIYILGLRKRVSYLVKLAKEFIRNHDKILETGEFEKLPGVGKYIASTVRLILGYDTELVPDSSIARVFSRLFGKALNSQRPADTPWVYTILNKCAPSNLFDKKEYFLAIVDLAWEICRVKKPLCHTCPLREKCLFAKKMH